MDIHPTDRTYKVIALARRTADARHARDIGTQDILYALAKEGSGIAANILRSFDIDLAQPENISWTNEAARAELASLCGEAYNLMQRAEQEGWQCRKRWPKPEPAFAWIGTEHILLAMTTNEHEAGSQMLIAKLAPRGNSVQDLRCAVLELIFGSENAA